MEKFNFKQKAPAIQEILDKAAALPDAEQLAEQVSKLQPVTYAELKALRDAGNLVPGMWYRITDYVTTVSIDASTQTEEVMVRSAGHPFDVIVLATATGALSEYARAIQHDGDEYFADCDMSAWRLYYTLDNDRTRFSWADTDNGKGVVYRMIDEHQNDLPYDFKNVQFLRYLITGNVAASSSLQSTSPGLVAALRGNFDNKSDSARDNRIVLFRHPWAGYVKESVLYDEGVFQNDYNITADGTRMFCVLVGADSHQAFAECSSPKWYYTFASRYHDDDMSVSSKTAMKGVVMKTTTHDLCENVFFESARMLTLANSYRSTFSNVTFSTFSMVQDSSVADTTNSYFIEFLYSYIYSSVCSRIWKVNSSYLGDAHSNSEVAVVEESAVGGLHESCLTGGFYNSSIDASCNCCDFSTAFFANTQISAGSGFLQHVSFIGEFRGNVTLESAMGQMPLKPWIVAGQVSSTGGSVKTWSPYDAH